MNSKRFNQTSAILFMCLFIFGMFLGFQYKSTRNIKMDKISSKAIEIEELQEKLNEEKNENARLLEQNKILQKDYLAYVEDYVKLVDDYELDKNSELLNYLKTISGLTDVKGEGIIVTMNDAKKNDNDDLKLFLIHDMDLVRIVNVLRESGAVAIAINGERILSNSEIMCAGPTVRINRNRYPVPYVIKAIGDKNVLAQKLESSAITTLLRDYRIEVNIAKKDEILIDRYPESIDWMISDIEVVTHEDN